MHSAPSSLSFSMHRHKRRHFSSRGLAAQALLVLGGSAGALASLHSQAGSFSSVQPSQSADGHPGGPTAALLKWDVAPTARPSAAKPAAS